MTARTHPTATAKVRCIGPDGRGALHEIRLTERGRLVLCDHDRTDLVAADARERLDGPALRCIAVLRAWRAGDKSGLPTSLETACDTRVRRPIAWPFRGAQNLPLRFRLELRVCDAVRAAYARCDYRQVKQGWESLHVKIGPVDARGSSTPMWSKSRKRSRRNSTHTIAVPLAWYARVHHRGLAVLDGKLVLDVDGRYATIAAQSRGFSLRLRRVRLRAATQAVTP